MSNAVSFRMAYLDAIVIELKARWRLWQRLSMQRGNSHTPETLAEGNLSPVFLNKFQFITAMTTEKVR